MSSSFRRTPCTQPSINKIQKEMQCLTKLFLVLAQSLIRTFPKSLYLKRSTKGAMNSSFRRALCTKASISQKLAEMQCLRNCSNYCQNVSVTLSQSSCIKALYERSNKQLLSQSTLYLAFYQQTLDRNAMFKQIASSTSKISHQNFSKVVFLKRHTKGALISSFRRGPWSWYSVSKRRE